MGSKVAVIKVEDTEKSIQKGIKKLLIELQPSFGEKVFIKPNFVVASSPERGVITDPRIIKTLIKEIGEDRVVVGDGGIGKHSFDKISRKYGLDRLEVPMKNLNLDEGVEIKVKGKYLTRVNIAKSVVGKEIISLPKLKIHTIAGVTLGVKNLIGVLLPKPAVYMHNNIHGKLVDLLRAIKPVFTIVDGIYGGERDELFTRPVKTGVLIGGDDVVAVDAVSSSIMGFDPMSIPYIRMAHEEGLGMGDIEEIEILGDSINDVKKEFKLSRLKRAFSWTYRFT